MREAYGICQADIMPQVIPVPQGTNIMEKRTAKAVSFFGSLTLFLIQLYLLCY